MKQTIELTGRGIDTRPKMYLFLTKREEVSVYFHKNDVKKIEDFNDYQLDDDQVVMLDLKDNKLQGIRFESLSYASNTVNKPFTLRCKAHPLGGDFVDLRLETTKGGEIYIRANIKDKDLIQEYAKVHKNPNLEGVYTIDPNKGVTDIKILTPVEESTSLVADFMVQFGNKSNSKTWHFVTKSRGMEFFIPKTLSARYPQDEEFQGLRLFVDNNEIKKVQYLDYQDIDVEKNVLTLTTDEYEDVSVGVLEFNLKKATILAKIDKKEQQHLDNKTQTFLFGTHGVRDILSKPEKYTSKEFSLKGNWKIDIKNKTIDNGLGIKIKGVSNLEDVAHCDDLVVTFEIDRGMLSFVNVSELDDDFYSSKGLKFELNPKFVKQKLRELETLGNVKISVQVPSDFDVDTDLLTVTDDNIEAV